MKVKQSQTYYNYEVFFVNWVWIVEGYWVKPTDEQAVDWKKEN